ncbi:MAG: DUF2334 domain-containing protein [Clostridium sp.]|uniref:DUF2334 domain-containing protein n=1 Tax=Clostridium sp. TaxID=1506 RepID=UPI0025BA75C8|nr:DUF2334 domain-containing protein [Clostridium sp.]MCE5221607.1 DUF2334 domain-containing protein [Clostridium sp.]
MIYKNKFLIYKIIVILICFIITSFFTRNIECKAETNKENLQVKGEIYFYLDDVTPFNELNNLIDEISYLKDNGIKFFIESSPVFVNEDLKAMRRFAACLRYAQANGGKIVLKFPILNEKGSNGKSISAHVITEKVKKSFDNYTNYWVYPIGMSVKESLLYREDLKELWECTDTLFLNSQDNINNDKSNYTIKSYENIIQKINLDNYIKNNSTNIYDKSAICVKSDFTFDEFKKNVDEILNREISFTENNKLNSYMKFNNEVKSNSKGIFFNNKDVTQQRFICEEEYKNAFAKEDSKKESPSKKDLTLSNKIIEIVSAVASLIFLIILVLSKKIERKRFFK